MRGSFESFVAQRYLSTRKKGAFVRVMMRLAQVGIALGVFGMVVVLALMTGTIDEVQSNLFSATAHFSVFHALGDIPDSGPILEKVRKVPGVVAASPMRLEQGLLRPTRGDAPPEGLMVKGVDPASAHATSSIFDSLKPLSVGDLKPGEIVIGGELQRNLGLRLGDEVAIIFFRLDLGLSGIQPRMMAFKLVGTFESHNGEYDKHWAFIHLDDAKSLAISEEAEFIEVRTKGVDAIDRVKKDVIKSLNQGLEQDLFLASDLRETNKAFFAGLRLQKLVYSICIGFIVLIAAFNIVASLVLLVTEKRRDLGVLLSLGATPRQVQRIFELQGLRMSAVGTLWGLALSIPTCLIVNHYRLIKLPGALFDFITYLPFHVRVFDVVCVAVFPLVLGWLASRYPAKRASRVDPVEALRAE
jgi:lipoprotein-releasing system permease protein